MFDFIGGLAAFDLAEQIGIHGSLAFPENLIVRQGVARGHQHPLGLLGVIGYLVEDFRVGYFFDCDAAVVELFAASTFGFQEVNNRCGSCRIGFGIPGLKNCVKDLVDGRRK